MNSKDVVISVTGIQHGAEGPQTIEILTQGKYAVEPGKVEFSYQETDASGDHHTTTTFTVDPQSVELKRTGDIQSSMVFQVSEKNYCVMETPFGGIIMGLSTNRLRSRFNEHGGMLEIDYNLDSDDVVLSRHRFFITVEEPEKSHSDDIRWPN